MKDIDNGFHVMRRWGAPPTVFLTIRAPRDISDAKGKRVVSRIWANIGRDIKRAGHEHVGQLVYEKAPDLHAHAGMAVPKAVLSEMMERWNKRYGETVVAKPWKHYHSEYITKQRKCEMPDFEASIQRRRDDSAWIDGPRYSKTTALKAILTKDAARKNSQVGTAPLALPRSLPPLRLVVSNAVVPEPTQLSLFGDHPVSRLADYGGGIMSAAVAHEVEWHRRRLGMTQARLVASIGISRPQITNALHGRFGLSEWAAARLREFLLEHRVAA